jgi:hypothetical protein
MWCCETICWLAYSATYLAAQPSDDTNDLQVCNQAAHLCQHLPALCQNSAAPVKCGPTYHLLAGVQCTYLAAQPMAALQHCNQYYHTDNICRYAAHLCQHLPALSRDEAAPVERDAALGPRLSANAVGGNNRHLCVTAAGAADVAAVHCST